MDEQYTRFLNFLLAALDHPIFTVGASKITLLGLLKLAVLIAGVFLFSRFIRRYLLVKVLARTRLQSSIQYAISKVAGYVFIAIGLYVALYMVGIDLSALAVVAGAIGVGIGFGLQNIVNNFFSGLIILAERPITVGDRVEVSGVSGQVSDINLRSTTVVTNDNISIIVPNSDFITNAVVNWSHGDPKVRMRLPFGVAYGSDVEKLRLVASEMAGRHPQVMKDPPPTVYFTGFGDSSLNFELVVWTAEMTTRPRRFHSDLYFGLEKALRDNQIEIPFPQRDLHLRSGTFMVQAQPGGGMSGQLGS